MLTQMPFELPSVLSTSCAASSVGAVVKHSPQVQIKSVPLVAQPTAPPLQECAANTVSSPPVFCQLIQFPFDTFASAAPLTVMSKLKHVVPLIASHAFVVPAVHAAFVVSADSVESDAVTVPPPAPSAVSSPPQLPSPSPSPSPSPAA